MWSCIISHRPVYREDQDIECEVIEEEEAELNIPAEESIDECQADSEDEDPVFLDISGLKSGKDQEVYVTVRMTLQFINCL